MAGKRLVNWKTENSIHSWFNRFQRSSNQELKFSSGTSKDFETIQDLIQRLPHWSSLQILESPYNSCQY